MLSAVITRLCPRHECSLSDVAALLAFAALIVAVIAVVGLMVSAPVSVPPVDGGRSYRFMLILFGAAGGGAGAAFSVWLLERAIRIRQRYEQRKEIDA